jgi:hypothetical protein
MNARRIMLGGLIAGLLMVVLDSVTNAVILKSAWDAAYARLHLSPSDGAVAAFWTTFDLVSGILIAFLYAAMRPRFGPGPKTAVIAALVQWLVLHMTFASHVVDGVFPAGTLVEAGILELVSAVAGGLLAGKLYQEAPNAERAR